MLDMIQQRRSIRKYTTDPVSDEQIGMLLEAAMAAPSGSNRQPWEFVVVRDTDTRRALGRVHVWAGMAADAPVVIVVCGHPEQTSNWQIDCAAATENLLLAVTALGLGAVWVGIDPGEHEATVRRIVGLPVGVNVLCLVPLGHPAEFKPPHTQYDAKKVHWEKY